MLTSRTTQAEACIAALEAKAVRHVTRCGDGKMMWRRWGVGAPLVLLHGSHGSWMHWFRNIEALAADRTLWIPDLPGSGDSDLPPGDDHAGYVDPIAPGILQLIGADPVDVMGFSFGGVLATHLAARHPRRVKRVLLVDPGGLDTPLGDLRLQRLKGLEGAAWENAMRANMLNIMLHDPAKADDLAMTIYRMGMHAAKTNPGPLIMPDHLLRALTGVQVPVDAIWGAYDGPHPDPTVQENALRAFRPDMRFRVVADAGHWCMFENAETFNRIARELLSD